MEKRTGRILLRWLCVGLLCLASVGNRNLRAEGVPPVIKYQAVLRNVEGEPMVDRTDLAVRITLRQGSPNGDILYQETHTDLATDAFGLLLLEIGRGDVSNAGCGSLAEVPWENSPIYAQVEIQADGNGYTMMGASELLSVPYALYAGGAGVEFDLSDGYLPKYDADKKGLVNSNIYQFNDQVIFSFAGGEDYAFPTTRGKEGEVLTLTDGNGTLGWRAGGGGGSGVDCPDCDDFSFVYWDKLNKTLKTGDLHYDDQADEVYVDRIAFVSRDSTRLEGGVVINAEVSGDNNLQYNGLPRYNVWVGGADSKSHPYILGAGVNIDSTDKNKPVLNFGGGHAAWDSRIEEDGYYIYTKDEPGKNVQVGVGTGDTPKARFHMQGGSFLLSGDASDGFTDNVDWTAGNHLYWHSGKGALRMGKFDQDMSGLWHVDHLAENSIALGTNADASDADNVAIGREAKAVAENTMVFGRNVRADGGGALALGTNLKVSGVNAIGIGVGYSEALNAPTFYVKGEKGIGLGYDVMNEANNAVVIGQNNRIDEEENNSIVLGSGYNSRGNGPYNIILGADNQTSTTTDEASQENVQIGRALEITNSQQVINIGTTNKVQGNRSIAIGQSNKIYMKNFNWSGICIGYQNELQMDKEAIEENFKDYGPVLIGQGLKTPANKKLTHGVFLGRFNAEITNTTFSDKSEPALVVGVGIKNNARQNALELSVQGELRVPGIAYAKKHMESSDSTLKTDIQPLDADFSVLQALQPKRYRFKADEQQTLQFGFIAQDVEAYFPHLVQTDGKGLKSLNYTGLLPVLWQYTQRLEQTVATQAAEIDRLKTEVESLKADVQAIKAAVGLGE